MTDTVLVTGASGFIAGHVVLKLLGAGYAVRGTVRSAEKGEHLKTVLAAHTDRIDKFSVAVADLGCDAGWAEAVKGCRYVQHVASPFPAQMPKDDDALIRPAVDGARRVLTAASEAGVARTVLTSSFVAVGYGKSVQPALCDENDWTDPAHPDNSAYTRSKTLAEKAAWDFIAQSGTAMELAVVNPALVLGPILEPQAGTSVDLVRKLMRGDLPGAPRIGFGLVDVRDVADLHVRAMTSPDAAGERFIAATDFAWIRDVGRMIAESHPVYARKMPKLGLPDPVVRLAAKFDPAIRDNLFELGRERRTTARKAHDQLGWQPRNVQETVSDTADALIEQGLV